MENKDHYQISTSWNEQVLEIRISGQAMPHDADVIAREVFEIAEVRRPSRVLIDVTNLQGRLSIVDYYHELKNFPLVHIIIKTAVVDLPENESNYTFQETAMVNVGYQIRFFSDIRKARAWLEE